MTNHKRAVLKSITYRFVCSAETFAVVWLLGGTITLAGGAAIVLFGIKLVTYYLHERLWDR